MVEFEVPIKMKTKDFDFNINRHITKLIQLADKRIPGPRSWLIEVMFWDDTDYRIQLQSSWGEGKDVFFYQKSIGEYRYRKDKHFPIPSEN